MPIAPGDILYKLSVTSGAAGNTTAGTTAGSLGKYVSTTQVADASLNNLFDDVTSAENVAQQSEYRCVFVHNTHATLTLQNTVLWVVSEIVGGSNISVSVDTTAASAVGASGAQAKQVGSETTAPTTQTFTAPTTKSGGLSLGSIGPGQVKGIWIRRSATNSETFASDGGTLRVEGETNA